MAIQKTPQSSLSAIHSIGTGFSMAKAAEIALAQIIIITTLALAYIGYHKYRGNGPTTPTPSTEDKKIVDAHVIDMQIMNAENLLKQEVRTLKTQIQQLMGTISFLTIQKTFRERVIVENGELSQKHQDLIKELKLNLFVTSAQLLEQKLAISKLIQALIANTAKYEKQLNLADKTITSLSIVSEDEEKSPADANELKRVQVMLELSQDLSALRKKQLQDAKRTMEAVKGLMTEGQKEHDAEIAHLKAQITNLEAEIENFTQSAENLMNLSLSPIGSRAETTPAPQTQAERIREALLNPRRVFSQRTAPAKMQATRGRTKSRSRIPGLNGANNNPLAFQPNMQLARTPVAAASTPFTPATPPQLNDSSRDGDSIMHSLEEGEALEHLRRFNPNAFKDLPKGDEVSFHQNPNASILRTSTQEADDIFAAAGQKGAISFDSDDAASNSTASSTAASPAKLGKEFFQLSFGSEGSNESSSFRLGGTAAIGDNSFFQ